jgi:3-phenylpropionate/trans-cinnamate dioxygenase ferredoxin subunit
VADDGLEWVAAKCAAPGESRAVAALVRGRRLVVCRAGGRLYALEDRCPHASEPLSGGALRGYALECPYHGGRLDVRDGRPLAAPIRRVARTFSVREVGERVEVGLAPEERGADDGGLAEEHRDPAPRARTRRTPCTTS